jgi:hypothetical protein
MLDWMTAFSAEQWTAFCTFVTTVAVLITTGLVVPQVRSAARSLRLQGTMHFLDEFEEARNELSWVASELPADYTMEGLSEDHRRKIDRVINCLNGIGLLIESGLLDKRLVFGIAHSVFIRCWHVLRRYAESKERLLGTRYGRRLARLDRRAKLYHDLMPDHRVTEVLLPHKSDKPIVIYKTIKAKGFRGLIQRSMWRFRRFFAIY